MYPQKEFGHTLGFNDWLDAAERIYKSRYGSEKTIFELPNQRWQDMHKSGVSVPDTVDFAIITNGGRL